MISSLKRLTYYMPGIQILFTLVWLVNLAHTDSYFSIYALIAFASFALQVMALREKPDVRSSNGLVYSLSVVFSFLIILANYSLFTTLGDPALIGRSTSILMNIINSVLTFLGGIFVFHPLLSWFFSYFPRKVSEQQPLLPRFWKPVFLFVSIFFVHFVHFLLVEYPGNLTEDTFTQISEMVSGKYSNFNTFWHTVLLQSVYKVGFFLFGEINAAVALVTVLQLLLMVFAFTHCLMSMIQYGLPKWMIAVTYLFFAILPYHMALGITIWKDVLFAGGCLLMISSWLRIQVRLGAGQLWNYIVFIAGSLLFIVSRTNGWVIYLVTFLVYLVFVRKNRILSVTMGLLAVLGWFMLNPALDMLGVEGGDLAESLSVPIQQVSRVIADGGELTEEETALLSRIMDLEEVPELYTNWISDPMKVEVRSKDYLYFQEHLGEYAKLWIRLGIRYPGSYLKAWVDQTKGYWNGGYDYAMYSETITDNPYGVEKSAGGNPVASLFRLYFGLSRHLIFFEPLHSIGLHVWIFLLCFVMNLRRRRQTWILSVPLLLLLVGLWFGTPVYCCFRYVYPLFVSFPLIVSTALYQTSK